MPLTFGWLKPIVLLPTSLLIQLSPEQIEMIVLHELAHIRRHDYLWSLGQSIAEIVLFYHPAYWFIARVLEREREFACDQMTVEATQQPEVYARTLVDIAATKAAPLGLAASGRRDLSARIKRVVTPAHPQRKVQLVPALILLGLLGIASVTFALQPRELTASEVANRLSSGASYRSFNPVDRWLYVLNGQMQTNRPLFLDQNNQADGWKTRYVPVTEHRSNDYLTKRQRAAIASGQYTGILIVTSEDYQPEHIVYGSVVKRKKGYLIPAITVRVKGKDISTATNEYGDYRLVTSHRLDTLEFLFDGDVIEEAPIAGRQRVDLTTSVHRTLIKKQIRARRRQATHQSAEQWLYVLDGQIQTARPAFLDQDNWQDQWEIFTIPEAEEWVKPYLTATQQHLLLDSTYSGILFIISKELIDDLHRNNSWPPPSATHPDQKKKQIFGIDLILPNGLLLFDGLIHGGSKQ